MVGSTSSKGFLVLYCFITHLYSFLLQLFVVMFIIIILLNIFDVHFGSDFYFVLFSETTKQNVKTVQ